MKKSVLSFLFVFLFIVTAFSQIKKVNIDVSGDFEVVIKVNDGTISVSTTGIVEDVELGGNVGYNSSGKISYVGSTNFGYNSSGKISYVGSINIGYNSSGKVSYVGSTNIGYNSSGNVSYIGSTNIGYNSSGKISYIGSTNYGYNSSGKISYGERVASHNGITFSLKGGY